MEGSPCGYGFVDLCANAQTAIDLMRTAFVKNTFLLLMYYFMYVWLSEDRGWALALSGVCFGLGAASKWTCLYAGAGLGVLWALHWLLRFVREGRDQKLFPAFVKNAAFCVLFFVAVPGLIYYLSYLPYGTARNVAPFTRE